MNLFAVTKQPGAPFIYETGFVQASYMQPGKMVRDGDITATIFIHPVIQINGLRLHVTDRYAGHIEKEKMTGHLPKKLY